MSFARIVTPDTIRQLQADVRADYTALDAAVQRQNAASTPGDQAWSATLEQWAATQDRVAAYLKQEPSWLSTAAQADEGDAIQKELAAWHDRLNAQGVNVGPAHAASNAPTALGNLFDSLTSQPVFLLALLAIILWETRGSRR